MHAISPRRKAASTGSVAIGDELTAMMFGYSVKPSFTVENEAQISRPPTVDFNKPAPAAPAASK